MSAEKPRQARSFSSSRVIGPVVSWEPTVVIFGSRRCPAGCPCLRHPQARRPSSGPASSRCPDRPAAAAGGTGSRAAGRGFARLAVRPRPMISGMRPPARTSSRDDQGLQLGFWRWWHRSWWRRPCRGAIDLQFDLVAHVHLAGVDFDRQAPASSMVLKKIGAIWSPGRRRRNACSARRECLRRNHSTSWWRTCGKNRYRPRHRRRRSGCPWQPGLPVA